MQCCLNEEQTLIAFGAMTDYDHLVIAPRDIVTQILEASKTSMELLTAKHNLTVKKNGDDLLSILTNGKKARTSIYAIPGTSLVFVQMSRGDRTRFSLDLFKDQLMGVACFIPTSKGDFIDVATGLASKPLGSVVSAIIVEFQFAIMVDNVVLQTIKGYHRAGDIFNQDKQDAAEVTENFSNLFGSYITKGYTGLPRTKDNNGVFILDVVMHEFTRKSAKKLL